MFCCHPSQRITATDTSMPTSVVSLDFPIMHILQFQFHLSANIHKACREQTPKASSFRDVQIQLSLHHLSLMELLWNCELMTPYYGVASGHGSYGQFKNYEISRSSDQRCPRFECKVCLHVDPRRSAVPMCTCTDRDTLVNTNHTHTHTHTHTPARTRNCHQYHNQSCPLS